MAATADVMDKIVALCKRRGFIFQSSEVYGGIGGFWDYGPLGTELKRNVKDAWWLDMVRNPPLGPDNIEFQMVGVDCSIIMNPKVWEASGHVSGFNDPLVDCRECKARFRADKVFILQLYPPELFKSTSGDPVFVSEYPEPATPIQLDISAIRNWTAPTIAFEADSADEALAQATDAFRKLGNKQKIRALQHFEFVSTLKLDFIPGLLQAKGGGGQEYTCYVKTADHTGLQDIRPCPRCNAEDSLTEARSFNLMFQTYVGALQDSGSVAYLRPETAQGIFANFKNVLDSTRVKLPLGIAQIGKAFRNEINPRNYTFRSREFEQYEIEFFCHPSEADMWYEFWRDVRHRWYVGLGLRSDKLRLREHEADELAHYARTCADVEYDFPFGLSELEGIANRTDFDLKAHIDRSGKDLSYFDDQRKERFVPYVIEPSGGVDRSVLAFITEAYTVDENRASPEFMKFHPRLAPVKAAVFPLVAKDGLPEIAEPIYRDIKRSYPCQYDAKQSIGRRYARMDEAGTPFCFTIDGQTKQDGTVTVRDRDDASQIRIDKSRCLEYLRDHLPI